MRMMTLASLLLFSAVGEAQDFCRFGRAKPASYSLHGPRDDSLRRKNARIKLEGLEMIASEKRLQQLTRAGYLVPIRETEYLKFHKDFKRRRQYQLLRPNALAFVDDLAAVFYDWFAKPLRISSAVRTVPYQRRLVGANVNAAPIQGDRASPHLTGATIDIAALGLAAEELRFLRSYLLDLEERGLIEATEERKSQRCFDIMVFSTYPSRTSVPVPSRALASAPQ